MADLFQTTADQGFNAFQNPLNPFNTTQGAWNIDPTYLTPNYAAPYRPQYQGPMGAPPPGPDVGMGEAFKGLFTPFAQYRPYGNPVVQEDPYFSALTSRPMDASMWTAERVVAPAIAFYAGLKASSISVKSNSAAYTSTMKGIRMLGGMSPSMAAMKSSQMSLGARIGSSIGHGVAGGISGGLNAAGVRVGATASAGLAGSLGLTGAALGSLVTPLLAGQAIMNTAEATVFDPYTASRNTQNALRANFANVMMGTSGDPISGFGISREKSASVANNLTRMSIDDRMLDTNGMADLTDLAARSGMLDSTQTDQIEAKMKTIAKQVKVMMRVANEPDFRAAMEMLAELKVAGAGENISGRVLHRIGGSAAVAGVSVQKMMNTVGAQGQYLYQANGMAPYLGQIHAANTYGAFSSAYRMGLIGDSTMAKFGGREGATQLAMTGQINATQTPYNQIMLMNKYLHGGEAGGVVGNLSKIGGRAAGDPLALAGAMGMYEHEMSSRQLMEEGPGSVLSQISHIGDMIPGMKNRDGSIDVEKAYLIMTRQMNLGDMEAKAMLKELYANHNPQVYQNTRDAMRGNQIQDLMKTMDQEGLGYGPATGFIYGLTSIAKGAKRGVSDATNAPIEWFGKKGDQLKEWYYGTQYGSMVKGAEATSFDEFMGGNVGGKPTYRISDPGEKPERHIGTGFDAKAQYLNRSNLTSEESRLIGSGFDRLNELAKTSSKTGELARVAINPNSTPKERTAALDKLNASMALGTERMSSKTFNTFTDRVLSAEVEEVVAKGPMSKLNNIEEGVEKTFGKKMGVLEAAEALSAMKKIHKNEVNWDGDDKNLALARKIFGENLSQTDLAEKATKAIESSFQNQVAHLPAALAGMNREEILSAARRGDKTVFGAQAGELKSKIKDIESSSLDEAEKRRRIEGLGLFGIAQSTGQPLTSPFDKDQIVDGLGADAIIRMTEGSEETAKKMRQNTKLMYDGTINFDTGYSNLASIKLDQAVNNFGEFVGKLDKVADKFAEGAKDSGASKPFSFSDSSTWKADIDRSMKKWSSGE